MRTKPKAKAGHGNANSIKLFETSGIPIPTVTDPQFKNLTQMMLAVFQSMETVKTDEARPQEISLTDDQKAELLKVVEFGLLLAFHANKNKLEAIAAKGRFLCEVDQYLKENNLRIFRSVCAWCGWKKSSAYNWMKLWKVYGESLTAYAELSERQLLICLRLDNPKAYLDSNREEIAKVDPLTLEQIVAQAKGLPPKPRQPITSKHEIGHFLYTQAKNKATITGLSESDHNRIKGWLESLSLKSTVEEDNVSSALDTPEALVTAEYPGHENEAWPEAVAPPAPPVDAIPMQEAPDPLPGATAVA